MQKKNKKLLALIKKKKTFTLKLRMQARDFLFLQIVINVPLITNALT